LNIELLKKVCDQIDPARFHVECCFRDLGHLTNDHCYGNFSAWLLWVAGAETNLVIGNYEFGPAWDNSGMYYEMETRAAEVLGVEYSSEVFKLLSNCASHAELVKAVELLTTTAELGPAPSNLTLCEKHRKEFLSKCKSNVAVFEDVFNSRVAPARVG
jgi:hypothetical protein